MRLRHPAIDTAPAEDLFRSRLENQIDLCHPLAKLAGAMPSTTPAGGRPALPLRLMAGLLYLKHAYDLSDEAVCERWLENPYWQFFTGEVFFQTRLLCDPISLVRWRQRLGEVGMEELLARMIDAAQAMKAVDVRELSRGIVDVHSDSCFPSPGAGAVAQGGPARPRPTVQADAAGAAAATHGAGPSDSGHQAQAGIAAGGIASIAADVVGTRRTDLAPATPGQAQAVCTGPEADLWRPMVWTAMG